ncbi:MAG TPA: glycerophosphodiester phosphodiesterase [Kofleriaceae bacterium]|nr:glycerophosphodiester phosphodiesterase [Kofleriaceae bacterium]
MRNLAVATSSQPVRRSSWGRTWPPRVISDHAADGRGTLRALREAVASGADAVALDVMRCGSGDLVIFHEHTLAKFGGRHWEDVSRTPLPALRELDLGGGERVPLLVDGLAAVPPTVLVDLRLRPAPSDDDRQRTELATTAAAIAAKTRGAENVMFGAADGQALASFPANVPTALLVHGLPKWVVRPPTHPPRAVELELPHCDRAAVRQWHSRGIAVHLGPATTKSQLVLAWSLHVDGVITTDPAAARQTIDQLLRVAP